MSRQQANGRQPQQEEENRRQQPSGSQPRTNLYLDFPRQYERQYNLHTANGNHPPQSGFVSSTKWTPGDSRWYMTQTEWAPSNDGSGPVQDSKVTNSREESDKFFLRQLYNGSL